MEATGKTMKGTWSFGCSCSDVVEFALVRGEHKVWLECLKCGAKKIIQHDRKKVMAS